MSSVRVEIPGLRLVSEANQRGSWHRGAGRAASQRAVVALALRRHRPVAVPCDVRVVRVAPRDLDDDNLARACKAVRDEVARWLGVDDRDPRVTWHVGQAKGRARQYGVRIVVRAWRPDQACARVRVEGEDTCVDLVLTVPQRVELTRALAADVPDVTFAHMGLRLTLSTARAS